MEPFSWLWAIWCLAALAAGVVLWALTQYGMCLLPPRRRTPTIPWGAKEVGAVVLLYLGCGALLAHLAGRTPDVGPADLRDIALNALGGMTISVLGPLAVRHMAGAEWYQFGLHCSHWARSLAVGMAMFFLVTPAVHLAYFLATQVYVPQPHPVEKLLRAAPTPANIALVLWSAALVAPLSEELLFRGILFGWLRRCMGWRFALLGTALLFAMLHFEQWPAPIPIFVLALTLGYAYHRTNSLVAPLTLHVLFNGSSLLQLLLLG